LRLITPFCSTPGILEAIKDKEIRIIISGNCGFELDKLIAITGLVRRLRPPPGGSTILHAGVQSALSQSEGTENEMLKSCPSNHGISGSSPGIGIEVIDSFLLGGRSAVSFFSA